MDFELETKQLVAFLNKFRYLTTDELSNKLNFSSKAKNINALLIKRIEEGYKGKELFEILAKAANLTTKTLQLKTNGRVQESMSFPAFDYRSLIHESWEDSEIKRMFSANFIFCVFGYRGDTNIFKGAFLWKMPVADLEGEVKAVWQKTKDILLSGDIVKNNDSKMKLRFPAQAETRICHVRPHGKNSMDINRLPINDQKTNFSGLPKQSFWLNRDYLDTILKDNGF